MKLKKHTLSFIAALAVTFMAIESAMVKSAEAIEPPIRLTASVAGNKVTLNWYTVGGATGYKLCYSVGRFSGVYDGSVDVGNVTSIEYEGLPDGSYFVAITAYDGISESPYSNKISFTIGAPGEFYQFERMWPILPQPWYFNEPSDVAIDHKGYVYVADYRNDFIQKFDSDGNFITKWGSVGSGDGQFGWASGISVDSQGNVYVADRGNNRIQKFDSDGNFITKWGSNGSGDGQFLLAFGGSPIGISVDSQDFVYVVDFYNNRIQKFDSDGNFVIKWGSYGSGDGQFSYAVGIAVDSNGNVYVADRDNHRIQKFDSDGNFITKWGSSGSGDGQFDGPHGVSVDSQGYVYVTDTDNHRIQKFDSDGNFITKWGSKGSGDGQFDDRLGISVDSEGFVYVADTDNHRIQKFDSDGNFISKWESRGSGDGQFDWPNGILVDSQGYVYVADTDNFRIQKFDSDGNFITKWGSEGFGDGQFGYFGNGPRGISVDSQGFVYVADTYNDRIHKFDSDGNFITKWGSYGSGDGQFWFSSSISVDSQNFIYVTDSGNHRIQKFDSDGNFITKWGSEGSGDGQFDSPSGIAVNSDGNVYVMDSRNNRIQKFDSNGNFITKWGSEGSGDGQFNSSYAGGIAVDSDGNIYVADTYNDRIQEFDSDGNFIGKWESRGSSAGQFNHPEGISVGPDGRVYIADADNHRIQVLKKATFLSNSKAIIVAGGGPFVGNNLWSTTQTAANYTYNTLTYQGYTKESIFYLSADTDLDLDGNGVLDDVDADATNDNLQEAVTTWASDADDVVIYLVDHGGNGTFRMSGTEVLNAADLNTWLNELQRTITGKLIIVYDACEAGSFMASLASGNEDRIVITSTSPGENAYFISNGTISFSRYFWTQVYQGNNLADAFTVGRETMGILVNNQTPLLDANGDGTGNTPEDMALARSVFIGTNTVVNGDAPVIGSVSPEQTINGTNSATIYADGVTDTDGISRVWAVIIPPDFKQGSSGNPIQNLPSIDLKPVGSGRYEAVFNDFTRDGTYNVSIFAMDAITHTSMPIHTTVSVNNPMGRKAIIVAGGERTDLYWTAVEKNATLAYETLKFQGYSDEDIYYMSASTTTGVDVMATLGNIDFAINTWARDNTLDLVIYLIGNGDNKTFKVNDTDTLQVTDLDNRLDNLQSAITGNVTVIYDAPMSGGFISSLRPPTGKQRIVVCSAEAGSPAFFLSGGDICFSRFFWQQIANGDSVYGSFVRAGDVISGQSPQLDDTGNGVGNEYSDGLFSRNYYLGSGIILAGDAPLIGSVSPEQTLVGGGASAVIWADNVTTTNSISRVWAVITPPGYSLGNPADPVLDMPSIGLADVGNNRYEAIYRGFTGTGTYNITVYAMDTPGSISSPKKTKVKSYPTGSEVIPYITANSSGKAVNINTTDNLAVKIEFDAGSRSGDSADWWVVADTPFPPPNDWYHYDLSLGWTPGLFVTYQGPQVDLGTFTVLNAAGLPAGTYTFYFAIDTNMNGTIDSGELYFDSVIVNITP